MDLLKKVVFGSVEHRIYIDYVVDQFSSVKVDKMKPAIRHIMRLSVYQLLYMDNIPESAVCNEAVKLVKKRKMIRLTGFVNGVLREIIRKKTSIELPDKKADIAKYLSVKYSFDLALTKYLLKEMTPPKTLEKYLSKSNEEAPITIRANHHKVTTDELIEGLKKEGGVTYERGKWLEDALHISGFDRLTKLQCFLNGDFVVQDESSMLVGEIGYDESVKTVIDVCSAPGGKALHIADKIGSEGVVKAYDVSDYKLSLIKQNIDRLGYKNIEVNLGDGRVLNTSLISSADLLIADVPCSGLGIIRKKPDIKWHASEEKVNGLVGLQREIMANVKQYVKPGGVMIYSTCTITKAENEDNVRWFLETYKDYELEVIEGPPYVNDKLGMVTLLPITNGPDGFFLLLS